MPFVYADAAFDWVSRGAALAGIAALVVAFFAIPHQHRRTSYLITVVLVGTPLVVSFFQVRPWIGALALIVYTAALCGGLFLIAYRAGQGRANPIGAPSDVVTFAASRPDAHQWLHGAISSASPPLLIDAMGVKVDSLYRLVRLHGTDAALPLGVSARIRVLILRPGSEGAQIRARLEGHDKVLHDAESADHLWPALATELADSKTLDIEVRRFSFCPAFYILRVNDVMLVGTYTAGSGYEGLAWTLKGPEGPVFRQFAEFFNRTWDRGSEPSSTTVAYPGLAT